MFLRYYRQKTNGEVAERSNAPVLKTGVGQPTVSSNLTLSAHYHFMNEDELKKKLTPDQYRIMRQKGTEVPFSGEYVDEKAKGIYQCAACGNELFSSDAKFDSGTGWPSFTDAVNRKNVDLREDKSHDMSRVEVNCKNCGSHLGHVFDDGPADRGGKRYCINSACLKLEKTQ